MEWIFLKDSIPNTDDDVLGCDWYPEYSYENFRIHVCEGKPSDQYWCGELTGHKIIKVKNSICPDIGNGESAYWMPLPNKNDPNWIRFDLENPPRWEGFHEVLIRLKNGDHYTGFIEINKWCPTFNMFRYGYLESIDAYMELPEKPKFIPSPELTDDEKRIRKEKSNKWLSRFKN